MVIQEVLPDGRYHSYSDQGVWIMREETGQLYEDVIGVEQHQFEETDIPIESEEVTPEEALKALEELL